MSKKIPPNKCLTETNWILCFYFCGLKTLWFKNHAVILQQKYFLFIKQIQKSNLSISEISDIFLEYSSKKIILSIKNSTQLFTIGYYKKITDLKVIFYTWISVADIHVFIISGYLINDIESHLVLKVKI
ncbi:hypothetical protein ATX69_03555 [Oenococcus oeni]|nr:hypothetical protein ATX69_03555 [Oenococcus oeni]